MRSGAAPEGTSPGSKAVRREAARETLARISGVSGVTVWTWQAETGRVVPLANHSKGSISHAGCELGDALKRIHPDDRKRVKARLRSALKSGKTGSFRFCSSPAGDGSFRHFVATHYLLDETEVQVIVQDITQSVEAETRLRDSEDHYRTAVDLNSEVLWLADAEGLIVEVGKRWEELVDITVEDSLGHGWASVLHPEDVPATIALWQHSIRTGDPVDVEYRIRLKDGSYRWMRARAAARRDADGNIIRWYGTLGDIHDRKIAEAALRESEAFATSILEASTMAIEVLDLEGRLIFINGPGLAIMEVDDFAKVRGRPFDQVWPGHVQDTVREAIGAARAGETVRKTLFGPTAKGTPRWWDITISPIHGADGQVARLLALSRDVSEAKFNEAEVVASARRLANVLESTMDSVISLDRHWKITYLNRRAASIFPPQSGPFVGRDIHELFDATEAAPFFKRYEAAMAEERSISFEDYLPSADTWFEIQAFGSHAGLIIFFRDVTERRIAQEKIAHLARHDTLTGLPNRMHFQQELDAALAEGGADQQLAVLSIDLDDFKLVNDTLGHPAGDALLREAASRVQRVTGSQNLAARLGGDEFAVMLRVDRPQAAAKVAQSILSALAQPYLMDGELVSTGASIGIAMAPRDGTSADALLHFADVALYRVKRDKGRDFRFFEPAMDLQLRERREVKRELTQALERHELSLVFQPQVEIGTNRLTAFEALLRWNHPTRGPVSPATFIPLAEESGLIEEIGAFVLEAGCAEAARWPESVSVAINLSPAQFRGRSVVKAVEQALARTGLSPSRLELEITESVLLEDSAESIAALEQFHRLGIRVALDDFGTGYSSLSYLRRFAFDKIKIDRSFIADLPDSEESAAIVRAIVGLGRSLKTRVTAEGVESWEQLLTLRAEGCNEAQGFLFSRPLPPKQAMALAATGFTGHAAERVLLQRPPRPAKGSR